MKEWMREGVYAMTGGPNYETDAEVNIDLLEIIDLLVNPDLFVILDLIVNL